MSSRKRIVAGKRHRLSLRQKIEVIEKSETMSIGDLVKKYNSGFSTIHSILAKKSALTDAWVLSKNPDSKNVERKPVYDRVNEETLNWFRKARKKGIPVSGPLLQTKAKALADQPGESDFAASNGWLSAFKTRNSLVFNAVCGEARDVSQPTVDEWQQKLPALLAGFDEKDVANCDETALFYRAIPQKSISFKGDSCAGGKMSKDRLSVLLCAFADGKVEKPLVIGKSAKPRCFKNVDLNLLPVHWESNKKAWMTGKIMEKWLLQFNHRMKQQNRKILLFMDNATSHTHMQLSNIQLAFFPPNTTSVLQPLDQGVIYMVKMHYRKRVLARLCREMDSVENVSELNKAINVLDAVQWLASAAKAVTSTCVSGCFRKAAFKFGATEIESEPEPVPDLSPLLRQIGADMSPDEFICLDNSVETEDDSMDMVGNGQAAEVESDVEESSQSQSFDSQSTNDVLEVLTTKQMLSFAERIRSSALVKGDTALLNNISGCIMHLEEVASKKTPKQTQIADYFKACKFVCL